MLAPYCLRSEREKDLRWFKRLVKLFCEFFQLIIGTLFNDKAAIFSLVGLQYGITKDSISVKGRLMKLDQMLEGIVNSFFKAHDLVFLNELCLIELKGGLHSRDLVLVGV